MEDQEWSREGFFKEILEISGSGTISTLDLLWSYGRERRGSVVNNLIMSDLERHGLRMKPEISEADYYGNVLIYVHEPIEDEDFSTVDVSNEMRSSGSLDESQMGWILSSLKEDGDMLDFLQYGDSVETAIETMKVKGRSKLPLFFDGNDKSTLIGTVTLDDLTFDTATKDSKLVEKAQTHVPVVSTNEKLFDWIPAILQHGFVYGKNSEGSVVQIYTTFDVAMHLNSIAQMFLRVNELEDLIRSVLSKIPSDEVKDAKSEISNLHSIPLNSSGDMIFSREDIQSNNNEAAQHVSETFVFADYMKCFGSNTLWDNYFSSSINGFKLDKDKCLKSLNDARLARNRVMHSSSQDILDTLIPSFECLAVWLRKIK